MTETELKKMSRSELLQMLILQSDENTALKNRVEELEKQIEKREILIGQSGFVFFTEQLPIYPKRFYRLRGADLPSLCPQAA